MKIRLIISGLLYLLITSCSTLFHQKTVNVNIYCDADSALVCIKDSIGCYFTPATLTFQRSKKDIVLTLQKDTIVKDVVLKSNLSTGFWLGNLFCGGLLGYAVDLTNQKRFTYPKNNYISVLDTNLKSKPMKWLPPVKQQLSLKISIPEGNFFYINKRYDYGSSFGFLGFSAGLEYYFTAKYSLNIDAGTMMNFIIPFPAPVDYDGSYDQTYATYIDLQLGRDFGRFHTDVGIQAFRSRYYEYEEVEMHPQLYYGIVRNFFQYNAGLAFSNYLKITNGFNLGINYYPSVLTWQNGDFNFHYTHLIMFELIFKIELFRPLIETAGFKLKHVPLYGK